MADSGSQVGSNDFVYQANDAWHQVPPNMTLGETVGVATDSRNRVYVFNRSEHPLVVFDSDGTFLTSWDDTRFVRPHGITIDSDDHIYLTDDRDHTVRKFTPDGELLLTLGSSGQASDTGVENLDYRTIKRAGGPFNLPTNLAVAPDGVLYVSDGYGNACIHKFAPDGEHLLSWGGPGTDPGQFEIPHGVAVDGSGRVFVCDRENSRLQLFTADGELIEIRSNVERPCDIFFDRQDNAYVAELGWRVGTPDPNPARTGGRVSIYNRDGELLSRFGGGDDPYSAGDFVAPHDIWIDSQGSIYVGEVTISAAANLGLISADCPSLQKFVRCP